MPHFSFKLIAAFIVAFFVIYLDPIQMGPFKWSQIWKSIFVLVVFFRYFILKKNKLALVKIYVIISVNFLITLSFFTDSLSLIAHCLKFLFFPSVFLYLYYNYKSFENYIAILKFSSIFVIISFIPFMSGLLPELGESYDLSVLGQVENFAIVGLFQKPHTAALTLSYASLTMLFLQQTTKERVSRLFYIAMFILSIFLILKTYVRTGLVMIFIGYIIIYFYKSTFKKKIKVLIITAIVGLLGLIIFSNEEANIFEKRFLGQTEFSDNSNKDGGVNMDALGSGRLSIWKASLSSLIEKGSILEIIFGIGENELLKRNNRTLGFSVFSHNGFLDMLVVNGVLGLILFFLFLKKWYKIIKGSNNTSFKSIRLFALAVFYIYCISEIFQGGPIIYSSIFISSSILILNNYRINTSNYKNISND